MYGERPENVFCYLTVCNEPERRPTMPAGPSVEEGIVRGIYRFRQADFPDAGPRVRLLASARRSSGPWRPGNCCASSGTPTPTSGR